MKQKLFIIAIGTIPIGFIVKNQKMGMLIQKRYQGYIKSISPVLQLTCSFSISNKFSVSEEVGLTQYQKNTWHAQRKDFSGIWNLSYGDVCMRPSIYTFDAFIRVVYSVYMLNTTGILLHSSCVVIDGKAYLFIGPSGSGKTTAARNANGCLILNDEICAVVLNSIKKSVYVRGTPFWGEMGTGPVTDNSYPLQGLYFLRKNSFSRLKNLSNNVTLQKILRCVCMYGDNTIIQQDILDICIKIVKYTHGFLLDFENNSNFLKTICQND